MRNDIPNNLFLLSQKMAGHVRTQNDRIFTNIGFLDARHLKQDTPSISLQIGGIKFILE